MKTRDIVFNFDFAFCTYITKLNRLSVVNAVKWYSFILIHKIGFSGEYNGIRI